MESKYTKDMKCIYCGGTLEVEDVSHMSQGTQDDHMRCPECGVSCIASIRYGSIYKTAWNDNK